MNGEDRKIPDIQAVTEALLVNVPRGLVALLSSNARDAKQSLNDYVSSILVARAGRR